ncbi:DUF6723 family protein [Paraburkholderia fynbosensis]|uniref:Uncharacterized protein n=1 Tax=Paraburkholderia fynbosensis TaxID=1200993 RepID=A0A6J5GYV8_9BURK|nr:DUF6723 family protein [Paraburkholderia fynbosensis]CAB3809479.1 hypothetical protein LMG27177_06819 [Paraburkholderia fynbosensis]
MARPKLVFAKSSIRATVAPCVNASDYRIYATYRRTGSGEFMGELKVVRTLDGRLLFPFDGAPPIGPFQVPSEARDAAKSKGEEIVAADLANPEH